MPLVWTADGTVETPSAPLPVFQALTALSGNTGIKNIAWPTHQVGDIGLIVVQSVGAEPVTLSTPSGFVEVASSPQATGTGLLGTRITVFWCRATSTSMPFATIADAGDHTLNCMVTYRGCVAIGDPWNAHAGDIKAVASTTLTYPTLTTTQGNCLIVMLGSRDGDSAAAWSGLPVNAGLADITERVDGGTISNAGGGLAIYDGAKVAAGVVGTSPATVTSSINAMIVLALKG